MASSASTPPPNPGCTHHQPPGGDPPYWLESFTNPTEERVLRTTGVQPDRGSHLMVMSEQVDPRRPDDVQDRQFVAVMKRLDCPVVGLAESIYHRSLISDRCRHEVGHSELRLILARRSLTVHNQLPDIHDPPLPPQHFGGDAPRMSDPSYRRRHYLST